MSEHGVFAVARNIFDHPFFEDEPFTEREAWIWLVKEAAWKPTRVRVGSAIVSVDRGELSHSIRFMAEKWRWHRSKVERFLRRLKTETMIGTRIETGVTVVTICNYNEYQRVSLPRETPAETEPATAARQQRDREEDREYRESTPSLRSVEPRARTRGSRLPEDFAPDLAKAREIGLSHGQAEAEAAKFLDHFRAAPGQRGVKTDWPATWRNWCRNSVAGTYARPNGRAPPGPTGFAAVFAETFENHETDLKPSAEPHDGPTLDLRPGQLDFGRNGGRR